MAVHGTVAAGFEGVRDEFAAFLAGEEHEPGAQLVVHRGSERVVDLWSDGVTGESLLGVFSSTKGAAYLVTALLVQDGLLDLDRTVASYWPDFAAEGKGEVTLRELLAHRAGVVGLDAGFTLEELADDRAIAARLAGQRPFWQPGRFFGYHGFVIGGLVGEVVFRATGRTLQEWYEERIRAPYGLDMWLGLPESEEPRFLTVLPMLPTPEQQAELEATAHGPYSLAGIAFNQHVPDPVELYDFPNSRTVRAKGQTSAAGIGSARGLAGMYAAAAFGLDGRSPLLKPDTAAEFARIHSEGTDLVAGEPDAFGLGFLAMGLRFSFLGADSYGHSGAAGSLALADLRQGFAYAYTRRRYAFPGGTAPENEGLLKSVVRALGR
ncbi:MULTISPECIES: EstA family serine hydrolase [Streptomyces]|uniref:EstA family serine hydrolase n=1 Tax=Streptomyces tsukubensis (strain DSM 42081 / NBRC 108919 / NRRL 18488 / 9993) TaxID=1114943 RepID=I2N583_STRT9|nr:MULTISPECIES: EstA family serine hydrolase [Streptomyces]AZK96197.1 EstA family serine hydrolase [Streptomyces tsukubensis]EIF92180.1 esterase [Streptomyces tsukubensis NRRL18488]MYS67429.1 EstA family serine hydrolase [Streptomyces sp. SID5473]QKM67791.1 EstA family serine hydrolase [Streptomyces tsukubensis NRRL18488]TAI44187.1 EstA family serine hydrolase [Streptomyces tsukubensis]